LRKAKGYRGSRRTRLRTVRETVMRALVYRTRDRKMKKRAFRGLWIIRLNAAARIRGLKYGELIAACRKAKVQINRQQLSELAVHDHEAFDQLIAKVRAK